MSLLVLEPRIPRAEGSPWVLDGSGRRMPGRDDERRVKQLRAGLLSHREVHALPADASDAHLGTALEAVHEPAYLDALAGVRSDEPRLMPGLAAPGLGADTAVCRGLIAAARESARAAVAAAHRLLGGARHAYALCRPPGHHAGPGWLGGYCYINNAAVAVQTLRAHGVGRIGILDIDLHYPNGTSAIVACMPGVELHSLHASPIANAPGGVVAPRTSRETLIGFTGRPAPDDYLRALSGSLRTLTAHADAIVLSLGYDTVRGDPHGHWRFPPEIFGCVGRMLAETGAPVCIVQEGGYHLASLAECSRAFAAGLLGDEAR
jgi:acetoin utilization deacetylase AcuC-like enzyme